MVKQRFSLKVSYWLSYFSDSLRRQHGWHQKFLVFRSSDCWKMHQRDLNLFNNNLQNPKHTKYKSKWYLVYLVFSFSALELKQPSWHNDVATTLSQRRCWRCHNVSARSKMRFVPTSVSDVVTMSLSDVVKTWQQRCYNVATTLSIGFLGHFTTDYSDLFPFIETWENYKSAKRH